MRRLAAQVINRNNTYCIENEAQITTQKLTATKSAKGDKEALAQLCEQIGKSALSISEMLRLQADAVDAEAARNATNAATYIPATITPATGNPATATPATTAPVTVNPATTATATVTPPTGAGTNSRKTTITSVAKTILTIITAIAATLAISVGAMIWFSAYSNRQTSAGASGGIIFTSDDQRSFVNPTSAYASSGSWYGELYVYGWDIQTIDGETILYAGDTSFVGESIFSDMRENCLYGDYELVFLMEDVNGTRYELAHNFFLFEEE